MSRSLQVLTVVASIWLMSCSSAIAQIRGDSPLPTQNQLSRLGLERAWWGQAVLNPSRDKVRSVSVDEDLVYVQSTSGVTTAFDAETGRQAWAVQLGRFDPPSFPAVSNEELVLIVVGSTMYAVEKKSGRTMWTLVLPGQPSTGPAIDDKQVYVGTLDGSLYAFSLRKIRQLFEERRLPQWSSEAQVWMYRVGKEITSPPIPAGRTVNFASRDGSLYSVASSDRQLIYQLETDKPIVAPLARLDNTMFMASEDYTFYAINLTNGKVRWVFTSGLPIRRAPWALDHDLYVLPDRGGMYSLDPETGDQRWWGQTLSNFLAVVGGNVAAGDDQGNLVMVSRSSRKSAEVVGSMPLRRFSVRIGNDRTDRIYLSTESGLVVCLRQLGHSYPVFHRNPDRLPLLPEFEPDDGAEAPEKSESAPSETE